MSDIASLSKSLDTVSKLVRVLGGEGVSFEQLLLPMNDTEARANLAAYLRAGCPKIDIAPVAGPFERNEHGHAILTITGLDLAGSDEVKRLRAANYRVGGYAKSCFTSAKKDGYDKLHRLEAGKVYKIALVPGKEIESASERSTANLRKLGEKYGYEKPLAGIIPRIREVLSDEQMKALGIWYVAALHDPIKDSDGSPSALRVNRYDDGRWVGADWGDPVPGWRVAGAFAFPVPASSK